MAFQNGKRPVTTAAKGDKADTGTPVTVAPTKKWAPSTDVKLFSPNYGTNNDPSPSSVEGARTSPLADELKRVNAEADGGDELQRIIEQGTARNSMVDLASPQTRSVPDDLRNVHPAMKRQTTPSKVGDVVVGTLPATCGASAAPDPSRTTYDPDNK